MTPAVVLLRQRKIPHRVVDYDHDPGTSSYGDEAAEALGLDPAVVFKTLMADVDGTMVVAVVPVTGSLDLKGLARAAGGKKASMADPGKAERSSGYVLGGISPLGQRKRLATYLDDSALTLDELYVSAGRRGLEIALAPIDLITTLDATVAPLRGP